MIAAAAALVAGWVTASPSHTPLAPANKVLNDDTVSPGWLGLVVFLSLALGLVLLLRSFRHQLAKVPKTFDPPADPGAGPDPGAPPAG